MPPKEINHRRKNRIGLSRRTRRHIRRAVRLVFTEIIALTRLMTVTIPIVIMLI